MNYTFPFIFTILNTLTCTKTCMAHSDMTVTKKESTHSFASRVQIVCKVYISLLKVLLFFNHKIY